MNLSSSWLENPKAPGVDFALSQPVTGLCTAGAVKLLGRMLAACEGFRPMKREAQAALIAAEASREMFFAT